MKKAIFKIQKMDCPSEEQLLRMKLEELSEVQELAFDIPNRKLTVFHAGDVREIAQAINSLKLNSSLLSSHEVSSTPKKNKNNDRKILWSVLGINFTFFIVEIFYGWISNSMALIADSLDMLADSFVYGMSLLAVSQFFITKKRAAKFSGYTQIVLALLGIIEVIRRFLKVDVIPDFKNMIIVSLLALLANTVSLYLIQKSKNNEVHMKAATIFTSNDIIINVGVIVAGILIYLTHTNLPDLIIGVIVFLIVLRGAFKILRLSK